MNVDATAMASIAVELIFNLLLTSIHFWFQILFINLKNWAGPSSLISLE